MGNHQEASKNPGREQTLSFQLSQLFNSARFSSKNTGQDFDKTSSMKSKRCASPIHCGRFVLSIAFPSSQQPRQTTLAHAKWCYFCLCRLPSSITRWHPKDAPTLWITKDYPFPGQTQGHDKPYQSVQFSSVVQFHEASHQKHGPYLSWELCWPSSRPCAETAARNSILNTSGS